MQYTKKNSCTLKLKSTCITITFKFCFPSNPVVYWVRHTPSNLRVVGSHLNLSKNFFSFNFVCRLRSIATHRDHFVRRLSVRPSVCPSVCLSVCLSVRLSHFSVTLSKAMFRRRHMHSSECCHYFSCYTFLLAQLKNNANDTSKYRFN